MQRELHQVCFWFHCVCVCVCVCVCLDFGFSLENCFKKSNSNSAPSADVVHKLEEVLEETLLKNIQLKQDLETLGNHVDELRKQNQDLKKTSLRK
jgi:DNA-binding transcriptional MerR regulator